MISGQMAAWNTAHQNYGALQAIHSKTVDFSRFRMIVQFNPERERSTTAPVGTGIRRPCFLCAANRPHEQESVRWKDYEILVNPYPIFNPHLTIPAAGHTPQLLRGKLYNMVELSRVLPEFVLTFNGARSGASAPDHFHFQAVHQSVLPAVQELPAWKKQSGLYRDAELSVWGADDYLRPAIVIEGDARTNTAQMAEDILAALKEIMSEPDEAQVNALAWHGREKYFVVFFPRTAHRPRQFYAEGEERFLSSPGAIDLAGVMITVRPEDYRRTTSLLMEDLFSQVVPDVTQWERIKNELSLCLHENLK